MFEGGSSFSSSGRRSRHTTSNTADPTVNIIQVAMVFSDSYNQLGGGMQIWGILILICRITTLPSKSPRKTSLVWASLQSKQWQSLR
jgi:hypothetical protein